MTAEASVTPTIEERKPCSRCSGHGRLLSQVTGRHDGPRCPRCQGRKIEARPTPPALRQNPPPYPDPQAAKEMLRTLQQLGAQRPIGHWADPDNVVARREEIDAEIRRLRPSAINLGIRPSDIAEALQLSRQQVWNIVNGYSSAHDAARRSEPRKKPGESPPTEEASIDLSVLQTDSRDPATLLEKLDLAGALRKEWRRSQTDEGYAVRQQITEAIRSLAEQARKTGVPKQQIADIVGVTRPGLDYILQGQR